MKPAFVSPGLGSDTAQDISGGDSSQISPPNIAALTISQNSVRFEQGWHAECHTPVAKAVTQMSPPSPPVRGWEPVLPI